MHQIHVHTLMRKYTRTSYTFYLQDYYKKDIIKSSSVSASKKTTYNNRRQYISMSYTPPTVTRNRYLNVYHYQTPKTSSPPLFITQKHGVVWAWQQSFKGRNLVLNAQQNKRRFRHSNLFPSHTLTSQK